MNSNVPLILRVCLVFSFTSSSPSSPPFNSHRRLMHLSISSSHLFTLLLSHLRHSSFSFSTPLHRLCSSIPPPSPYVFLSSPSVSLLLSRSPFRSSSSPPPSQSIFFLVSSVFSLHFQFSIKSSSVWYFSLFFSGCILNTYGFVILIPGYKPTD